MNKTLAVAVALLLLALVFCITAPREPKPEGKLRIDDPFSQPYRVTILDDNQVQLASKSDTLILFLENSATFNDEYVVFVKSK